MSLRDKARHKVLCEEFENFLRNVPLEAYREELMHIKTVEQDLPLPLNPLPDLYAAYWQLGEEIKRFPSYEEFFTTWWENHLKPIDSFISRYFWGCSYEFVKKGFKARLYRTAISVWTQFHFGYKYLAYGAFALKADAELDRKGIDFLIVLEDGEEVALQIKKETYRSEVREGGRFARRAAQSKMEMRLPILCPLLQKLGRS